MLTWNVKQTCYRLTKVGVYGEGTVLRVNKAVALGVLLRHLFL